jgi:hypothetical protein
LSRPRPERGCSTNNDDDDDDDLYYHGAGRTRCNMQKVHSGGETNGVYSECRREFNSELQAQ